jgi:hypothetical protein
MIPCDSVVKNGHVCWSCMKPDDQKYGPPITDFCMVCGHRGEGKQAIRKPNDLGSFTVVPKDDTM